MTMGVIAAVAEFERDLLMERTQAGLQRAKASGKTLGRPQALTGDQQKEIITVRAKGAPFGRAGDHVWCIACCHTKGGETGCVSATVLCTLSVLSGKPILKASQKLTLDPSRLHIPPGKSLSAKH